MATPIYRNTNLKNTGQVVKATPGYILGWHLINAAASIRYVKIYDKVTAPTASDTPVMTLEIGATSKESEWFPERRELSFDHGIGVRACTGIADSDNTAPTDNDVVVHLVYR